MVAARRIARDTLVDVRLVSFDGSEPRQYQVALGTTTTPITLGSGSSNDAAHYLRLRDRVAAFLELP